MTTGTVIVQDALQAVGAHSVAKPAGAESLNIGFRRLKTMLEKWLSRSIFIGATPLKVIGDELGELPDTTNAIWSNLALILATDFDNGTEFISPATRSLAAREMAFVETLYQKIVIPPKIISSTAPLGQGNVRTFAG